MKLRTTFLVFISLVIFIAGCEEDNSADGQLPMISTDSVNNITSTTAISGGNVTDDGSLSVTARGVCWNITQNPTINDTHTNDGTGTGSFTSNLSGLIINTILCPILCNQF